MDNLYDLTGLDPNWKREDKRYMVWKSGQTIEFKEPAFSNSIKVWKLSPSGAIEMLSGSQWMFRPAGVDTQGISDAKLRDPDFELALYNSITITDWDDDAGQYEISIEYQALRSDPTQFNEDLVGPDYSPGTMRGVLQTLDFLVSVKNPVSAVTSDTISSLTCLDVDLSGIRAANYIHSEIHTVNVPANISILAPVNGSFYKHDVKLVLSSTDEELVEGTDYIVLGMNSGKTQIAMHDSGVYDYILLKSPIVGNIKLTYHAFGGEVSRVDINVLRDALIDINTLLRGSDLLTSATLGSTPIIKDILARLAVLEEIYRHYPADTFTMNIGTNNMWVDIAQIAHGAWSETGMVESTGNGEFRIELPNKNYVADINLRYNVDSTMSLTIDPLRVVAPDYAQDGLGMFEYRIVPKFRIVWNKKDVNSGIVLQMSISAVQNSTTIVKVSDRTGSASPWELTRAPGVSHPTTTTSTTLPGVYYDFPEEVVALANKVYYVKSGSIYVPASLAVGTPLLPVNTYYENRGRFVWNVNDSYSSKQSSELVVYDEAYTVWLGAIPVKDVEALSYRAGSDEEDVQIALSGIPLQLAITGTDVNIGQIKAFRFTVYDRYTKNLVIETSTQIKSETNQELSGLAMYYIEDLCSLRLDLKLTESVYTGTVFSQSGTNSLINKRFDLRQIEVLV